MMKQDRKNESGNALWLILIAIILLGLLSAMLSRSSNTSDDTGKYERETIDVSKFMRYASGLETAVKKLQSRGCSENEISFNNAVVSGFSNPSAPVDKSCDLYEPEGAGLTYKAPEADWLDSSLSGSSSYGYWQFEANHCVLGIGTDSAGCTSDDSKELLVALIYLKKDLCIQLNKKLGVTNPGGNPPQDSSSHGVEFSGVFGPAGDVALGDDAPELIGKASACYQDTDGFSDQAYIFYHVLLAR